MILAPAAASHAGPYIAVLAAGFLVGIAGHIIRSRAVILTGILIVGGVSAYFAFVVGKLS